MKGSAWLISAPALTGPQFYGPRTSLRKSEINFPKSLWGTPELGLDSSFSLYKLGFPGDVPDSQHLHFLLHRYRNRASTLKPSGGENAKETSPVKRACLSPVWTDTMQALRRGQPWGIKVHTRGWQWQGGASGAGIRWGWGALPPSPLPLPGPLMLTPPSLTYSAPV